MEPAAAADKRHAAVLTLATDEKWPEEWRYCYVDFERVAARANEDLKREDVTRDHIAGMRARSSSGSTRSRPSP